MKGPDLRVAHAFILAALNLIDGRRPDSYADPNLVEVIARLREAALLLRTMDVLAEDPDIESR